MSVDAPAYARLRRLRRTLTVLSALTTSLCLVVLSAVAIGIDGRSRDEELTSLVRGQALALSRTAYFDADRLHLEYLGDDEVSQQAQVVAVVQDGRLVYSEPSDAAVPDDAELSRAFDRVVQEESTVPVEVRSRAGAPRTWAGAPVWDGDTVGAVVLVGVDPRPAAQAHALLVRVVLLGSAALVLLAALAAHVLSGRAVRPALQSLDQQERFLTEAAHELRTPLSALTLLVEGATTRQQPAEEALRRVSVLVPRLDRLVDNLLVRARLRAGTVVVRREPLRLDQLVEQVVEEAAAVGITVSTVPSIVRGDPGLLEQAVRNLLDNAVRHGGGLVEVDVRAGAVRVRDRGPGLPPDRRTRALEPGVTFGGGTGTGLSIVAWVAALHEGTLELDEPPGGGLRASLVLSEVSSAT